MDQYLDKALRQWLENLSREWGISTEQAANVIAADEIRSRFDTYPALRKALSQPAINQEELADAARECWALGGRFDAIRLNRFTHAGEQAMSAIQELIDEFPKDSPGAVNRIDTFVERAVDIAYVTPTGSADRAGAALLCSVILTSLYPERFVDFRSSRWERLARTFEYGIPLPKKSGYGDKILWASGFATDLSETKTFQQFWPEEETLWTLAGISWTGPSPRKPELEPVDSGESESFPEGAEKRRLHTSRERNASVVRKAKERRSITDPMLRCEVCGFSFIERYGRRGEDFIEAHHKKPVASLKRGDRTKIEDIALICSNCHRMIHRGDRTLSVEELRKLI